MRRVLVLWIVAWGACLAAPAATLVVDLSGAADYTDIQALSFLFLRGKVIEPPVGACGIDPTEHSLACESFPGCEWRQR